MEGEGIQATRGGVALAGRQLTPARTGESMWSRLRDGSLAPSPCYVIL